MAYLKTLTGHEDSADGFDEEGFDEMIVESTTTTTESAYNSSRRGVKPAIHGAVHGAVQEGFSEEGFDEETVVESRVGYEETSTRGQHVQGGEFGFATETKTAETEQLTAAEMEEKKTFTIRSVIDPYDSDNEISLQEAILMGIIKPDDGMYVNTQTGENIPIPLAMSQGLIKVEFTSVRRSREKKSSIGIITVKTVKEVTRPYRYTTCTVNS